MDATHLPRNNSEGVKIRHLIQATAERAAQAEKRIEAFVERTPLQHSAQFSDVFAAEVYFKLENLQTTGSFKLRGATNRLLTLSDEQRDNGCVAASSGNHGAAVACAAQKLKVDAVIFVPEQTAEVKVNAIRHFGGDVRFFGTDGLDTEQHARQFAEQNGMTYLSPYNDEEVIAGQGTCGLEIIESLPDVDAAFIAVGGGGLIGGVASVLKMQKEDIKIYGCQPAASAVMAHSIAAGELLDLASEATLSDGTAGGIEAGAITFPLNQQVVDEFVLVTEQQIADAMRLYLALEGHRVEGAAGVAIAAAMARKDSVRDQKIVIIICGGNISEDRFPGLQ